MNRQFPGRLVRGLLALVLAGYFRVLPLEAEEAAPSPVQEESQSWLGLEYQRVRRVGESGSETEEYLPRGESLETWRQRVTVRRMVPGAGFAPEVFVQRFKRELAVVPGTLVEDCGAARGGRVLQVTQPGAAPAERIRSCVLVLYSAEAGLVLLQYAQHVERLEEALAELQLKAWRESLLGQARGGPSFAAAVQSQEQVERRDSGSHE